VACQSTSTSQIYQKMDGTCWVWAGEQGAVQPTAASDTGSTTQGNSTSTGQWVRAACNKDTQKFKKSDGSCWKWTGPPEQTLSSWEAFFFQILGRPGMRKSNDTMKVEMTIVSSLSIFDLDLNLT
jgi:hypothetical protein